MKLSNIFKKETKVKSNVQTLDKKQLAKVIGGTDGEVAAPEALKTKHDAAMAAIQNTR